MREGRFRWMLPFIALPGCAFADQDAGNLRTPADLLQNASRLEIRYFDPTQERRTPNSVGDIDASYDISTAVECNGFDCRSTFPWLDETLKRAEPGTGPCPTKMYIRITATPQNGPSKAIYGDRTGTCLFFDGRYYLLRQNLIDVFRNRPFRDW